MRDNRKKKDTARFVAAVLLLTAAACLSGCTGGAEEKGLEEIALSDSAPAESDGSSGETEHASSENDGASADTGEENDGTSGETPAKEKAQGGTAFVFVSGAVNAPGVYELAPDARVYEAIELAGGLTAEADADAVNQAETVSDGEQIYIPTKEETQAQGGTSAVISGAEGAESTSASGGKVNINTAGKEELMTLTGIGEAKAQSILDYREKNGPFGSIEELMEIEGIKEGVFSKIEEDITV